MISKNKLKKEKKTSKDESVIKEKITYTQEEDDNILRSFPRQKINPIEEYFKDVSMLNKEKNFSELFKTTKEDIDTKTDIDLFQINNINVLFMNDLFLQSRGIKPVYQNYYEKYMRLLISKERKSRQEFVDVNSNKKNELQDILNPNLLRNK